MYPVQLFILSDRLFEDTLKKTVKYKTNATSVIIHAPIHVFWWYLWKCIVEKNQSKCYQCDHGSANQSYLRTLLKTHSGKSKHNATNDLIQVLWGFIWKCTAEKSQINATSVIMHATIKVLWIHIWTCTVEKIQTRATVVNIHATIQEFWGHRKLMCIKDNLAQLILTWI